MADFPPPLKPFGEYPPALPPAITDAAPAERTAGHDGALWPPFAPARDHVDGPIWARKTLVVFGAYGTPWSRALGELLEAVRLTVRIAWRHFPDEAAHPHAHTFALAAEAAARRGKFWVLTRELLRLEHDDEIDLHDALVRAGLDPERIYAEMHAPAGAARIDADVESARASGVAASPTLFIDGRRYRGELDPAAIA
jgi:hypothetical protein